MKNNILVIKTSELFLLFDNNENKNGIEDGGKSESFKIEIE
ncbi:hypothetical protein RV05_GL001308 [Enterococcus hirae]|nr:hypothetical protein [Enterococcus hirae]OJG49352.1 hypothetical protein RV05_GL001308 [Enterococcus hirae]